MIRELFFWFCGVNVLHLQEGDVVVLKVKKDADVSAAAQAASAIFSPAKVLLHSGEIEKIEVVSGTHTAN